MIAGKVTKNTKNLNTKCPDEFQQPIMKWIKIDLEKPYDFLLGMDWIEENGETINMEKQEIHLNNSVTLPFFSKTIHEEDNVLEQSAMEHIKKTI